jgi:hypothetical protein
MLAASDGTPRLEQTMKQMVWESPSFVELRMDAEIGSYQDDSDPTREEPAFAEREGSAAHS